MYLHLWARRFAGPVLLMFASIGIAPNAAAASPGQTAYYPSWGRGNFDAVLIDWISPGRARVVIGAGAQLGTLAPQGSQTMIALDAPISKLQVSGDLNSCDEQPTLRKNTTALVVRNLSGSSDRGTSQIVEIGTLTHVDGCEAGRIIPFGTPTDAGTSMKRLAMSERPSVRDVSPGTVMAGFGEYEWPVDYEFFWESDLVTLYAGGLALFARSGHLVRADFNNDKWLVFELPQGQRAFTRLEIDDETGAETWLRAEWSDGQPERVIADLVVKSDPRASFGSARRMSRVWDMGLFYLLPDRTQFRLYAGGKGERVEILQSEGTETHIPITWRFVDKSIVLNRLVGNGPNRRERTWMPLRTGSDKVRLVMESENTIFPDGTVRTFIPPRVNFYIDRGPAIAP